MSPYLCHIHNGLYVVGSDEGCQHPQCVTFRAIKIEPKVHFNLHHLKRQNREGTTTASEVRDVLDGVKPQDKEKITRSS